MGLTAFLVVLTSGLILTANGQVDIGLELQSLSTKLDDLGDNLETELNNVENEIDNVGNDIDNVGNEIDDLEDEVGDVEDELDDLKAEVQSLRSELLDELADLRIEIANCGGGGGGDGDGRNQVKSRIDAVENQLLTFQNAMENQLGTFQNTTLHLLQMLKGQITTLQPLEHVPDPRTLGERWSNPAKLCDQIGDLKPKSIPGKFWIENPNGPPVFAECATGASSPNLVSMRVAYIDMTNLTHKCPGGFTEYTYGSPKRLCARRMSTGGCVSATFRTHGLPYSTVYGRIISYQQGTPSGFCHGGGSDIDSVYLDGISLTYGSNPRKHIWSFANGLYERPDRGHFAHICPCSHPSSTMQRCIPTFVGNDYFCDSGVENTWSFNLYPNNPLWDGQGCGLSNTCCQFNNPPYFWKELPVTTTDNIEVRLCADQHGDDEDSPFELIELYIR